MSRGRHEAQRGDFTRDLLITVVGIAVVAVVVFGGLWAVSVWRNGDTTSTSTTFASSTTAPEVATSAAPGSSVTTVPPTTVPPATTRATIGVRDPSEITVQVLNAVGTTGLASEVSTLLQEAGYQTVEPTDYEPLLDRSQVLFKDGYGPEAFELAALFPDAQVGMSPDIPEDVDVMVLLGSSYEAG